MRQLVKLLYLIPLLLLAGPAQSEQPVIPEALKARSDESVMMAVAARGVQVYECRARRDQPTAYEWAFLMPQATLFDLNGRKIGEHYEGPTWEASDGSRISGVLKARADAPQPDAIPWLLLSTTSAGAKGLFSSVTSVQRVNTIGGVAPRIVCMEGNAGAVARVPYTADYYFLSVR